MLEINLEPFPILETEHLALTRLQATDEAILYLLRSDKQVNRYLDRPLIRSEKEMKDGLANLQKGVQDGDWVFWAIRLKGTPALIGTICFWNLRRRFYQAEIGFELLPAYWGKGYMKEAVAAVIDCGFKRLGFRKLVAYTQTANLASRQILETYGFQQMFEAGNSENLLYVLRKS